MKRSLAFLFLGSTLLTSCQIGGRYSADILLEDGSKYHFTNKQLSQEEYSSVFSRLKKPTIDYKYKFTLKRLGENTYFRATNGEYASYSIDDGDGRINAYLFTANAGMSFLEESQYRYDIDHADRRYHEETTVSYGTYNKSFDYGMAVDYVYDNSGSVRTTYYNPNIPITYPRPDETSKVRTPSKDYFSMYRFRSLCSEIINLNGVDTSIVDVSLQFSDIDYHFTDAPVFSHKLNSKYLVIQEKRRMPHILPVDQNVIYAICREIEAHSNYYFNTKYYYDYETGCLKKVQGSFNTLSTRLESGARISGSYTLEHQDRTIKEVRYEHDNYFNKFRNFKGVIEYREERQAV